MSSTNVWDKTNISENYPGITVPLTYSFIKDAYSAVYPHFLKLLGYSTQELRSKSPFFKNMLGYIEGEVFYNIENWYKLISLLPGYKYNKEFFENMLEPVETKKDPQNPREMSTSMFSEAKKLFLLLYRLLSFPLTHKIFLKEYKKAVESYNKESLSGLSNFELFESYSLLEERFFEVWRFAILNDFRVMISYGIFSKFLEKNGGHDSRDFYSAYSRPIGIDLLDDLISIAIYIRENEIDLSEANTFEDIQHLVVKEKLEDYILEYGARSLNELKLEDTSILEDTHNLIKVLKSYVSKDEQFLRNLHKSLSSNKYDENQIKSDLTFISSVPYSVLKSFTVKSIHLREFYRLKRASVYQIAKDYFMEMGSRFVAEGILEEKEDVLYLYKTEVLETLCNHRLQENMRDLVNTRKKTLSEHGVKTLARLTKTTGIFNVEKPQKFDVSRGSDIELKSSFKVTSSGTLQNAEVLNMPTLDFSKDYKGKVIVTHSTDPGWTIIFPLIKGIIIQVGGMLSHASVVAREVGIPCLVMEDALGVFDTGDIINLDTDQKSIQKVKKS